MISFPPGFPPDVIQPAFDSGLVVGQTTTPGAVATFTAPSTGLYALFGTIFPTVGSSTAAQIAIFANALEGLDNNQVTFAVCNLNPTTKGGSAQGQTWFLTAGEVMTIGLATLSGAITGATFSYRFVIVRLSLN